MISSITLIILQFLDIIQPEVNQSFWKIYIPVCVIETVVYFKVLFWWGSK